MAQNSGLPFVFTAAVFWAVLAFAGDFVFGTVRMVYLLPAWGEGMAWAAEIAGMLLLAVVLAGVFARQHPALRHAPLATGIMAFCCLTVVRLALSEVYLGDSLARLAAQFYSPEGLADLAGPLLFCLGPRLRFRPRAD